MATPTATVADVEDELGENADEIASDRLQTLLDRAARIVDDRLTDETVENASDDHIIEIEALTTAHLAFGRIIGAESGDVAASINQETLTVDLNHEFVDTEGPGGYASPFWGYAVSLEPKLQSGDSTGDGWTHVV